MIVVLVPELEALLAEADVVPRLLCRLLARSEPLALDPLASAAVLVTGQAIAAAPLSRLADCPDDADGLWLRADPIALQADLNAVWLQPSAQLSKTAIATLIDCFADEGLVLDFPNPARGYLRLDGMPESHFQPPWSLPGHSLDQVLPKGADAGRWRRLLNESQVILHQHAQSAQGRAAGSLWFWGPGRLPAPAGLNARVSHLLGESIELIGLARLLKLSHEPLPARRGADDSSLVLWQSRSDQTAADNLLRLAEWMEDIWRRLGRFGLDRLELASRSRRWVLAPLDRWKLWRLRPASLA